MTDAEAPPPKVKAFTLADIQEARAKLAAAPPRPWTSEHIESAGHWGVFGIDEIHDANGCVVDAEESPAVDAVVHCVNTHEALLGEVERLREATKRVREIAQDRNYHGAEKHPPEWHDGFESACMLWLDLGPREEP